MSKKVVLFVDDDEEFHDLWIPRLDEMLNERMNDNRQNALLVSALSIEDAEREFFAHISEIVAVVMDACVPGRKPNTEPLIREMRKHFAGLMIAVSSDPRYRKLLVVVGCDYEREKYDLPYDTLVDLLVA